MGFRERFGEVGQRTGAAISRGREAAGSAAQSVAGDRFGVPSDWMKSLLADTAPPSGPLAEPWSISIATIVRGNCEFPWVADKALAVLDRFGSVRIGPEKVGLDDTDVAWDDVVELSTSSLVDHLSTRAIDREVERLRALLPPFPYRTRALKLIAQGLMTLSLAALDRTLQEGPAARPVVSGLVYGGRFGRRHELPAGVTTSIMLGGLPAVNEALVETARYRGVPVIDPPAGTLPGDGRAEAVRAEIADVLTRQRGPEESAED